MRYRIREHLLAWGDDFTIRDDADRDVYFVDGRAFSFGKKLSFQDMSGNELLFIRQRVFAWGPTFEILRDDTEYATISKQLFTLFKTRFEVDVPGPNDYRVEGSFLEHEYRFTRASQGVVATVSKRWFALRDSYGVDIVDGEDDLLILATAIVIDQVCHEARD